MHKEGRERVKAALKNCGFDYPGHQAVTVNLAPADTIPDLDAAAAILPRHLSEAMQYRTSDRTYWT
ncbi:MAG: magnesium chelatase domain-containing protein [Candidatus Acidiferrales bacterium]